ncbi:MAG: hypothetical protein NTW19_06345 [Planctomycetota bacterium]|nr:hypothetical protein [Planctomycetota bacterium]
MTHQACAIGLVAVVALATCIGMALAAGIAPPIVQDEFSYLLAGDTFAHGRLANPPHPMWKHFESVHILQQPTYASIYAPAQGLMLALGQRLTGHAAVGVWLSVSLMAASVCWMLWAWAPPGWAILGGLLSISQFALFTSWSRSYWGGAIAAAGGALLFGALRRLIDRRQARDAVVFGVGLILLANTRPFEGFVVGAVASALLAWRLGRRRDLAWGVALRRVVLPLGAVLLLGAAWTLSYNWRVTGNPLLLPWKLHFEQYGTVHPFFWQAPRPAPAYNNPDLRMIYTVDQQFAQNRFLEPGGTWRAGAHKLWVLYDFFLGPALAFALLALPWVIVKDRWVRAACGVLLVLVCANLAVLSTFSHYAAPGAALVVAVLVACLRRLWRWRPAGPVAVVLILALSVPATFPRYRMYGMGYRWTWAMQRRELTDALLGTPGMHLVVVRGQIHRPEQTWIANAADIDHSRVVWARELSPEQDAQLLSYFYNRTVWVLDTDVIPLELVRRRR